MMPLQEFYAILPFVLLFVVLVGGLILWLILNSQRGRERLGRWHDQAGRGIQRVLDDIGNRLAPWQSFLKRTAAVLWLAAAVYVWWCQPPQARLTFPAGHSMIGRTSEGQRLITVSPGNSPTARICTVWDLASGMSLNGFAIRTLSSAAGPGVVSDWGVEAQVRSPEVLSPRGSFLAAWRQTTDYLVGSLGLWDVASGQPLQEFPIYGGFVGRGGSRLVFSEDETRLAVLSPTPGATDTSSNTWMLYDLAKPGPGIMLESIWHIALSPDGKIAASAGRENEVVLYDAVTGKSLKNFDANPKSVTSLAFSSDGRMLAVAYAYAFLPKGAEVLLFDLETQTLQATFKGFNPLTTLSSVWFAGDDRVLCADPSGIGAITWGLRATAPGSPVHDLNPLVVSADGKRQACVDAKEVVRMPFLGHLVDPYVRVFDTSTGETMNELHSPHRGGWLNPTPVEFSPDGSVLAAAYSRYDTTIADRVRLASYGRFFEVYGGYEIRLMDVATGATRARLPATNPFSSRHRHFSNDGQSFLGMGEDGRLHVWDISARQSLTSSFVILGIGILPIVRLVYRHRNHRPLQHRAVANNGAS